METSLIHSRRRRAEPAPADGDVRFAATKGSRSAALVEALVDFLVNALADALSVVAALVEPLSVVVFVTAVACGASPSLTLTPAMLMAQ